MGSGKLMDEDRPEDDPGARPCYICGPMTSTRGRGRVACGLALASVLAAGCATPAASGPGGPAVSAGAGSGAPAPTGVVVTGGASGKGLRADRVDPLSGGGKPKPAGLAALEQELR